MAEFQIVAKEIERMCKTYKDKCRTDKCPLYYEDLCYAQTMAHVRGGNESCNLEKVVMAWAIKHPEPVYPTWIDWLRDVGVIPTQEEASRSMRDGVRAASFYVTAKAFSQIPVDMAKRLEIKPKER